MNKLSLGSIIEQKFRKSGMSVKEFADRINVERTTVYNIFKQESMNFERLKKISEVLNYDFISEEQERKGQQTPPPKQTVFIAVEIDADTLNEINLPDNFIRLVKDKK